MNNLKLSYILFILCFNCFTACGQEHQERVTISNKDTIIKKYLKKGAWHHHFLSKEWEEWIDKGIEEDSTVAYLWQQKALPYWKQKKYSLAIKYYNKAVLLDRKEWLSRLGYLKCIFAKDYEGALTDLATYKNEFGFTFEQDHPLDFYEGICYLQLNRFDDALAVLKTNTASLEKKFGVQHVHYLDRYYLAIAYFENNEYHMAISEFDKVLLVYPNFSDAQFYKSLCLHYLGDKETARILMATGKINFEKGSTFNEDANRYETYPYQLTWQWQNAKSLIE